MGDLLEKIGLGMLRGMEAGVMYSKEFSEELYKATSGIPSSAIRVVSYDVIGDEVVLHLENGDTIQVTYWGGRLDELKEIYYDPDTDTIYVV